MQLPALLPSNWQNLGGGGERSYKLWTLFLWHAGLPGGHTPAAVCDSVSAEGDNEPAAVSSELAGVCHGDHSWADTAGKARVQILHSLWYSMYSNYSTSVSTYSQQLRSKAWQMCGYWKIIYRGRGACDVMYFHPIVVYFPITP